MHLADITSLCTVIPNNEGLKAIKYFLINVLSKIELGNVTSSRWTGSHTQLFLIWRQLLQQINGIGMRTKVGPSYSNLLVGYFENKCFSKYHGPKPYLYKRYIDDCVGATSFSRKKLNQFIASVSSFHPDLKYTREIFKNSLAFLDIKLLIKDNGLPTSV